jgi:hypothetical protein
LTGGEVLTVIYSLSTAPFFARNPHICNASFGIDRFELYTAALSSLIRRKSGNRTIMHTDSRGALYFGRVGLADLWDEIRVTIPDDLEGINPRMFWAAGKLFALRATPAPVLQLDTDFIAWRLPELADTAVAAHHEELTPHIYPSITTFKTRDSFIFDDSMNYSPKPLNTAFLYLPDEGFKQHYVEQSLNFMKSAQDCDDFLTYMVFAEQRLLAILANHRQVKVGTLFELCEAHVQRSYTHTWGAKQVMRDVPSEEERFCEKCRSRIRKDFPEREWIIERIEALS